MYLNSNSSMRRTLLFSLLALFSFVAFAQGDAQAENAIGFDKREYNFGDVKREKRDYSCTFTLENRGTKPLVLLSVNTSCSCLKAHYVRRPLKPGQSSTIMMTLEAAKMDLGLFHRVVEVQTNQGVAYITVRGNSVVK